MHITKKKQNLILHVKWQKWEQERLRAQRFIGAQDEYKVISQVIHTFLQESEENILYTQLLTTNVNKRVGKNMSLNQTRHITLKSTCSLLSSYF